MQKTLIEHQGKSVEIVVHDNEFISNVIRGQRQFFEIELLEFIRINFPSHKTVLDIGANIGNHSLFFWNFLQLRRLICFEPFPPNFQVLMANVGRVAELHNIGLGSQEKICGMRYNPENLGICVLDEAVPGDIRVKTIDSFGFEDVTLIKSDVEETHVDVLKGSLDTIKRCRPILMLEGNFDELFPLISPLGYVCVEFWPRYNTYCFVRLLKGSY